MPSSSKSAERSAAFFENSAFVGAKYTKQKRARRRQKGGEEVATKRTPEPDCKRARLMGSAESAERANIFCE